jgi:poly(3-hydroxybutyrate) depolymerase
MKKPLLLNALSIALALVLHAQPGAPAAKSDLQADWRQGVSTDLPAALAAAANRGGVLVCFSCEPLGNGSIVAQVYGAKRFRDWASENKLVLALLELPRPKAPDAADARARYVELTRQYHVAGSRTWLLLAPNGKERGRLCKEDVAPADASGNVANKCDLDVWLDQANRALRGDALASPQRPADAQAGWFARFGGNGWSGKQTVTSEDGAMNYTLFSPPGLVNGKKYPLMIWLHGGVGSNGDEIADDDAVGLSTRASSPASPAFLLIPSAIGGQSWRSGLVGSGGPLPSPSMKLIAKLVDTLPQTHQIDASKVVTMGESGGAMGSWAMLQYYPDRFCGAIINSGGGEPERTTGLAKQRIWIVHGEKDERIPIQRDQEMFDALAKLRGGATRVVTDGDWIKFANEADTLRFWKHTVSGHVPAFDYASALDWVVQK